MINYILLRQSRKTIAIHVKNGEVEVRAPLKASKTEIEGFLALKERWIKSKLRESALCATMQKDFCLNYGSLVLYRGTEYRVIAREGNRIGFDNAFFMPPNLNSNQIKQACIAIYRLLAKSYIEKRVTEFSKSMSAYPASIKINNSVSRWGSCSGKKSLNFSWRLVMADDQVIDYVIVHELAHIFQMNHSKAFWNIVEKVLPDYKQRKARLNKLSKKLLDENWK